MRDLQTKTESGNQPESVFSDFDRLFDGFFGGLSGSPMLGRRGANRFLPAYELEESEKGYFLSFDLPGVPKDEIKIEVKQNQLRISGERRREEKKTDEGRVVTERSYGRFERVFTLPADVEAEKIQANHDLGVLYLTLPKADKVQSKTIKIESKEDARENESRRVQ